MTKIVGKVNDEEKNEIMNLYEKKVALENLIKVINVVENEKIYEKLLEDYKDNNILYQKWWDNKSELYMWEKGEQNQSWKIDFKTGNIILDL